MRAHRRRVASAHDHEVWVRVASEIGSQMLTINHVFHVRRCLTPAFSGAASSTPMLIRSLLRGLRCNGLLDGTTGEHSMIVPEEIA